MTPSPPPGPPVQPGGGNTPPESGRSEWKAADPPEEKPWGPVRLRWRGNYLPPEVATLALLVTIAAVFVLGTVLWRTFGKASTESSATDAHVSRRTSLSSAATAAPGNSHAVRPAPTGEGAPPILPKPSAAVPQSPLPGPPEHPVQQTRTSASNEAAALPPVTGPAAPAVHAPVISTFSSNTQAVDAAAGATLSWAIAGETQKVIISPEPGAVGANGLAVVHPTQSTQYVITATGPGGSASDQVFVRVNTAAAPSVEFGADITQLKLGQTATLHWSVSGADQVTIDPGIGSVSSGGSVQVKPLGTTRYTLLARGPGGASGRNLTLEVNGTNGPSSGQLIWSGVVSGTQLVTIDHGRADTGTLLGALPGLPCILQPTDQRKVGIASAPSEENKYDRLVLRVIGHGHMTVIVRWSLL